MNKQIELKPCPFCGGEAEITVVKKGVKSIIECKTHYCGFMRHSFNNGDTDEHAAVRLATAWNRRANDKQSEGEWISVDDRLPDCAGQYIVYTKYGDTEMDSFFILPTDKSVAYFIHHNVTHWMPLPEAPKIKKTQN